ncbi:MAG: zinc ribbon domain-containing protein [Candidatus Methanoperedens sp.]|nr:zinc ribbon domain-containing protein [Candidatus Methanoperedens sp.]
MEIEDIIELKNRLAKIKSKNKFKCEDCGAEFDDEQLMLKINEELMCPKCRRAKLSKS